MEGTTRKRADRPDPLSARDNTARSDPHPREFDPLVRILWEADGGEWNLAAWAAELGISEDEMLIEIDRHLHHPPSA